MKESARSATKLSEDYIDRFAADDVMLVQTFGKSPFKNSLETKVHRRAAINKLFLFVELGKISLSKIILMLLFVCLSFSITANEAILALDLTSSTNNADVERKLVADGSGVKKTREIDLDRFENDIRAYEDGDKKNPPAPGGTVFVGSSSVRMWTAIDKDFGQFHAINRGFGGSTFPDLNHYVDRIVTNYKPSKIVVYSGTNDIAELHHTGEDISRDFATFVAKVQSKLPDADIYFISMSMAPSRTQWKREYDTGNELVRKFIRGKKHLHYVDVVPVMRTADGKLRSELFGMDQLHMNKEGYALWTPVVQQALK